MGGNSSKEESGKIAVTLLSEGEFLNQNQTLNSKYFDWNTKIKALDSQSKEFQHVKKLCCIPHEILKIEKVYNKWLLLRYIAQKCYYCLRDNLEEIDEEIIYHGSERDPHDLCNDTTGFDFCIHAKNPWGQGLKFSTDVMLSHNIAFKTEQNTRSIIIGKILVAKSKHIDQNDIKKSKTHELVMSAKGFDLLVSNTSKSQNLFIYFENYNVLPLYILTYDTSRACQIDTPRRWIYVDEFADLSLLPRKISRQIDEHLISNNDKNGEIKFKFNYDDDYKQDYEIIVQNKFEIFLKNKNKNNEKILLWSSDITNGNEIVINTFKKPFFTTLEKDFNILYAHFKTHKCSHDIKIEILKTLNQISNLLVENEVNLISSLDEKDVEFKQICEKFYKTMPKSNATVDKIEKINNRLQKCKYLVKKILIALKSGCINEKVLFHGTNETNPEIIYKNETGFEVSVENNDEIEWSGSNEQCCFSATAFYSNDYSYKNYNFENKICRQIFLASVLTGKQTSEKRKSTLDDYDSVYAFENGSDIYIIDESSMAYPNYLITYSLRLF